MFSFYQLSSGPSDRICHSCSLSKAPFDVLLWAFPPCEGWIIRAPSVKLIKLDFLLQLMGLRALLPSADVIKKRPEGEFHGLFAWITINNKSPGRIKRVIYVFEE